MGDASQAITSLRGIFPDLEIVELQSVVNRVGIDVEACCEYIVSHTDPGPGRSRLMKSNDPRMGPKHHEKSEEEAKSIAMVDYLLHQDTMLRRAQEEQMTLNLIEAMKLEEKLDAERHEEQRAQEKLTLQMLEEERLQRQAILETKTYECPICAVDSVIGDMYTVDGCDHRVCLGCMKSYIETKLEARDVKHIPCPMGPQCPEMVSFDQIRHVLPRSVFEKYDVTLLAVTLESDPSVRFCPRPNCGTAMLGDPRLPLMHCPRPGCNFAYCFNCREAWHADTTCELYQQWKVENANSDSKFSDWASVNTKPCPRCRAPINKDGGCNHMNCTRCHTKYCWTCLGDYTAAGHSCNQFS